MITLYHGTSKSVLPQILKEGLIPHFNRHLKTCDKQIWLIDDPEVARFYSLEHRDSVVLEVKVNEDEVILYATWRDCEEYYSVKPIGPDRISVHTDR